MSRLLVDIRAVVSDDLFAGIYFDPWEERRTAWMHIFRLTRVIS